jgi:hypothetical protein
MMRGARGLKYLLVELVASYPAISRLPGIDVVGSWDGSWGGHRPTILRLAATLSPVGANVDGLAYCIQ